MSKLTLQWSGPTTTIHGKGEIGGKGEGLAIIDQVELRAARRLRTEIITTEIYDRYRNENERFDDESLDRLRQIYTSFPRRPISVRASERFENDPFIPTSGESMSFMLPNIHPGPEQGFDQFLQAIRFIFNHFTARVAEQGEDRQGVAILVNPIPGVASQTDAGRIFFPMSSGVADSFFKHPLTMDGGLQDPREGFARVAFGHGYAVVLDMFEVIPVATIKSPIDPRLLSRSGQQYFYAIQMDKNVKVAEGEMSTMSMLHMRFADPKVSAPFRDDKGRVNFDRLIREDACRYRSELSLIMEDLSRIHSSFQIEFTWNVFNGQGVFHVVQYKKLRDIDLKDVTLPEFNEQALVSTDQFQGHGVIEGLRFAIVISPFLYTEENHDEVVSELGRLNSTLKKKGERYILICPGRLGTTNRRWGFHVDFKSISNAAVIVEYGYDIKGSPVIAVVPEEVTGGIYGSHFLYQILGGADEAERARRARMFGSQGTHFLTNLYTSGALYLFVNPSSHYLSKWFFLFPQEHGGGPIYLKRFKRPVTAYANLFQRRCLLTRSRIPAVSIVPEETDARRPMIRIINPHKIAQVFVFAASREIREAALELSDHLPHCEALTISDPSAFGHKLSEKVFILFVDEGAMPFLEPEAFKQANSFGFIILLTDDLRAGSAPTREEVERVCPLSKKADLVFYINSSDCHPEKVMPAAVRCAEDRHNIEYHKEAKRFIFLVVDDELRWFSQFLPVLYRIIGQRAGVLVARTHEEAMAIMEQHGSDVVCLITDMLFPKGGVVTADAGRDLVISTKLDRSRIPIIIASKADQGRELQNLALIMPKGDPEATEILDKYVHDFTGMGDFLFFGNGKLWRRASTLPELHKAIAEAPVEMLEEYAENDYFSTWLYMHGFRELGDRLRIREDRGDMLKHVLLSTIEQEIVCLEDQELVLVNDNDEVVGRARTIDDLRRVIAEIDERTLKDHSANDVFSMWLMRKGYPELADRVRPIYGEGEKLREELTAVIEKWMKGTEYTASRNKAAAGSSHNPLLR